MGRNSNNGTTGSLGCGCFLWVMVAIAWGILLLVFPKIPGYDETIASGEVVPGMVLRVEVIDNVTINDKNPNRVVYTYGDGKEASMTMALDESAKEGQELKVRVLGEHAYPEGIRPLAKPAWVNWLLIGMALAGALFIAGAVLRLLLIGGVVAIAGRTLIQSKKSPPPPPPSSPPPSPPSSPPPPPSSPA